jgi:hypothetical protein
MSWMMPAIRMIQPQVLRSLMMNFLSSMKKWALSMAATPQMQVSTAAMKTMMPAKKSQPPPLTDSSTGVSFPPARRDRRRAR